jgi:hypothetical protein
VFEVLSETLAGVGEALRDHDREAPRPYLRGRGRPMARSRRYANRLRMRPRLGSWPSCSVPRPTGLDATSARLRRSSSQSETRGSWQGVPSGSSRSSLQVPRDCRLPVSSSRRERTSCRGLSRIPPWRRPRDLELVRSGSEEAIEACSEITKIG